ncbi:hypothetical protein [Methanobrevibacter sp.]|uniref:hypothetical protein n=1 Tax=Methanobrevibacter sp. TaxID=66852 RepID=UPI00386FEB20
MVNIPKLYNDILTFLGQKFYTKNETDTLLNGKSDGGHTHSYSNITDKPSTFTPSTHTHDYIMSSYDNTLIEDNTSEDNTLTAFNDALKYTLGDGTLYYGRSGSYEEVATVDDIPSAYTHPTYTARTGKPTGNLTPGFGETATISQITSDSSGHVTGATDRTIKIPNAAATTSAAGLMSSSDKTKLNGIDTGANKTTVDTSLSTTSTNPVQNKVVKAGLDTKLNSSDFLETLNDAILEMQDKS